MTATGSILGSPVVHVARAGARAGRSGRPATCSRWACCSTTLVTGRVPFGGKDPLTVIAGASCAASSCARPGRRARRPRARGGDPALPAPRPTSATPTATRGRGAGRGRGRIEKMLGVGDGDAGAALRRFFDQPSSGSESPAGGGGAGSAGRRAGLRAGAAPPATARADARPGRDQPRLRLCPRARRRAGAAGGDRAAAARWQSAGRRRAGGGGRSASGWRARGTGGWRAERWRHPGPGRGGGHSGQDPGRASPRQPMSDDQARDDDGQRPAGGRTGAGGGSGGSDAAGTAGAAASAAVFRPKPLNRSHVALKTAGGPSTAAGAPGTCAPIHQPRPPARPRRGRRGTSAGRHARPAAGGSPAPGQPPAHPGGHPRHPPPRPLPRRPAWCCARRRDSARRRWTTGRRLDPPDLRPRQLGRPPHLLHPARPAQDLRRRLRPARRKPRQSGDRSGRRRTTHPRAPIDPAIVGRQPAPLENVIRTTSSRSGTSITRSDPGQPRFPCTIRSAEVAPALQRALILPMRMIRATATVVLGVLSMTAVAGLATEGTAHARTQQSRAEARPEPRAGDPPAPVKPPAPRRPRPPPPG